MTIEIHEPALEAIIERQMQSGAFRNMDELLTKAISALDQAPGTPPQAHEARNLMELFEPVRGLLSDEEIDTLFARNQSFSRELDLS